MDDTGRVFLNGNPLGPWNSVGEYGNATFWSADPAHFHSGTNELQISDANSGYGPSGAAFYAYFAHGTGGFDPGDTSQLTVNGPMLLNGSGTLNLGSGSTVQGDPTGLLINNATIDSGGPNGPVELNAPVINFGTFNVNGDVNSYANGDAFVQLGNLNILPGVAMKGMDSGGRNYAFVQGFGTTQVQGSLDFSPGTVVVSGGEIDVADGGTVAGCIGVGGGGVGCTGIDQQGGAVYVQDGGTIAMGGGSGSGGVGIRIQDGGFWVQSGGTIAGGISIGSGGVGIQLQGGQLAIEQGGCVGLGCGGGSGGVGFNVEQNGGTAIVNGTLAVGGGAGSGGVGYNLQNGLLQGGGLIDGSLLASGGTISPGNSPGTLTITGDFIQGVNNSLLIQLAGLGEYDVLAVGGIATLGGLLEVRLLDHFLPQPGDLFPFLTADSIIGDFDRFYGLDLGNGLRMVEVFDSNRQAVSLLAVTDADTVPEPGTLLLMASGLALLRRRRP